MDETGGFNPPSPVESTQMVDIRAVDLHSDGKSLTATLQVDSLNPESRPVLAHFYEVSFDLGAQRLQMAADVDGSSQSFTMSSGPAPSTPDEDQAPPGGAGYRGVADVISGSVDTKRSRISIVAPLKLIGLAPRERRLLSRVRAGTAPGMEAPQVHAFPGEYADTGRTDRAYRTGATACV